MTPSLKPVLTRPDPRTKVLRLCAQEEEDCRAISELGSGYSTIPHFSLTAIASGVLMGLRLPSSIMIPSTILP